MTVALGGAPLSELMRRIGHITAPIAMVYQVSTAMPRDRECADRLDAAIHAAVQVGSCAYDGKMIATAPRAVILGGAGAMGTATALRLASQGWRVDVIHRDGAVSPEFEKLGVQTHRMSRHEFARIDRLVADDTSLLVDMVAYCAEDVDGVLPAMRRSSHTVLVSSRAVYVDDDGNHINGAHSPRFPVPIHESQPTLPPAPRGTNPYSREGYAPCKVAAERVALESGLPVTVLRPSKVHGAWGRNPRTAHFVRLMTGGVMKIAVGRPDAVDHLSAATNVAELIAILALLPKQRILNIADPDTPTSADIAARIAELVGWEGELELVTDEPGRSQCTHPWFAEYPIVLDMTAAACEGYTAVGSGLDLLAEEVAWVLAHPQD